MIVPVVFFYISIAAWALYWWFIVNIIKKIGSLVFPLTLVFGYYIFTMRLDEAHGSLSLGWREAGVMILVYVMLITGNTLMRKFMSGGSDN
ncbi:hypothetical protein CRT46_27225 (plasmid) [Escherichia coli]|uniref:hypothetical protein n=1 Tax=Escherichia coli TaxID=562 RepID=UPI000F5FADFC|nr:hypothetical protein [Escherichia coli]AZH37151.1 hypothetical protein CRT46_27225 [Escherichia coli]